MGETYWNGCFITWHVQVSIGVVHAWGITWAYQSNYYVQCSIICSSKIKKVPRIMCSSLVYTNKTCTCFRNLQSLVNDPIDRCTFSSVDMFKYWIPPTFRLLWYNVIWCHFSRSLCANVWLITHLLMVLSLLQLYIMLPVIVMPF